MGGKLNVCFPRRTVGTVHDDIDVDRVQGPEELRTQKQTKPSLSCIPKIHIKILDPRELVTNMFFIKYIFTKMWTHQKFT